MSIDIIFILLLLLAIFKGLRRGLIIAVFSMLALMVGLAAALRLSVTVAHYLKETVNITGKWMPILAFLLVFILVILLVRWAASLIEGALDMAMLGWINKLAGIILHAAIYTTIFSVLLFYGTKSHFIADSTVNASKTYTFIEPWGPKLINALGELLPFFRNMFTDLEDFFGHVSRQLAK